MTRESPLDDLNAPIEALVFRARSVIPALISKIRMLEAESDGLRALLDVAESQANAHAQDSITLQRAVERVRALHFALGRNILGQPVCNECSPLQPMPCPTLRALGGS